jgi:hypothetical protein
MPINAPEARAERGDAKQARMGIPRDGVSDAS